MNTADIADNDKNTPRRTGQKRRGGVGKVQNKEVKLNIDPDVTPRQQFHRRIPFLVREDVEKELERLEKLDIIEKVEGPTPGVILIVIVPKKSGEVRVCVDMQEANKAINREKHLLPTIDDLIADLNGATHISTLDLSSGYHQRELAPESRYVCHSESMQQKFSKKQLENSFLVYQDAKTSQMTSLYSEKAKTNITRTSVAFFGGSKNNLRLNKDKFSKTEIKFYGHNFSSSGLKPNPRKVETIHKARPSQNHKEVKSLLGMAQYVSRFIPNYATITTPLPY